LFSGQIISESKILPVNKPGVAILKAITVGNDAKAVPVLLTFYRGDDKSEFERGGEGAIKYVS